MRAIDLSRRRQVIAAWQNGVALAEAASTAQISVRTARRRVERWRATGSIEPRRSPGRSRLITAQQADEFATVVTAHPTATLATLRQIWKQQTNIGVSSATMSRTLARYGWVKR